MQGVQVIRIGPEELLPLQDISRLTFMEAFGAQNTEENMRRYMEGSLSLQKLRDEI